MPQPSPSRPPAPDAAPAASLRRRLWLRGLALVGVAAALAVSWAIKVAEIRDAAPVPSLSPGTRIEAGPFALRPLGARLTATTPDGAPVPGDRAVLLDAEIENLASGPRGDAAAVLPRIDGLPVPVWLLRDRAPLGDLQPRLPERVAFLLPAPTGPELSVTILTRRWKPRDNLSGASGWFDPRPVAELKLPVEGWTDPALQAQP